MINESGNINPLMIFSFMVFLGSIFSLGYIPEQSDFKTIFSIATISFLCFSYLIKLKDCIRLKHIFVLGLVSRLSLAFIFPNLSDDIYRFLWDGRLILEGSNPYAYLPSEIDFKDNAYLTELFPLLNSPNYYSVYPPLCQVFFAIAASFNQILLGSIFLKLSMLCFEVGTFYFLYRILKEFEFNAKQILLYWLNPLVIVEITGNLHFEGMMLFFLMTSLFYFIVGRWSQSAITIACSVGVKLLPAMFAPLLIRKLKNENVLSRYITFGGVSFLLIMSAIAFEGNLSHFLESVNLYFQKFEFNASNYYFLRALGIWLTGYNQIWILGPFLSLITFSVIVYFAFKTKPNSKWIIHSIFMVFMIYLFNTTTVHPWYLSILIAINVCFNYKFIICWSWTIFLSYHTYSTKDFHQDLSIVIVEYALVVIVFYLLDRNIFFKNLIASKTYT